MRASETRSSTEGNQADSEVKESGVCWDYSHWGEQKRKLTEDKRMGRRNSGPS